MSDSRRLEGTELGSSGKLTTSLTAFPDPEVPRLVAYWKRHLQHLPALELPTDRVRRLGSSEPGERHDYEFEIPGELVSALQQVGMTAVVDLQTVLLAATQSLLSRYCRQEEFSVAVQTAASKSKFERNLTGLRPGTMLLRADLTGDLTVGQLLNRLQQLFLEALNDSDVTCNANTGGPGEIEVAEPVALPKVLFKFSASDAVSGKASRAEELTLEASFGHAGFDLELHLLHVGESLSGLIVYSTDLFDGETIERMAGHFQRLLEGIAGGIDSRVSALPLVTERERVQILEDWNSTASEYPSASSVHELFELQVERSPDSIALTFGDQSLSYRELNERSNQLAHRLLREGVERGSFVAMFLERTLESVVATLGILKAGAVYVPVDVTYPCQRVEFMLGDASVRVVVTHSSHLAELPEVGCPILCVDAVATEVLPGDVENPDRLCCGDDVAYVMYTSGSTGNPKGVIVLHRGIVRLVLNTDYVDLGPDDCIAHTTNIAFDVATFEIWGALLRGGKLAIASRDVVLSSTGFAEFLDRERVTTVCMTPSLFKLHVNWNPEIFGNVRQVLLAGEVMDPVVVRQCLNGKPPARLLNVYGPTENSTYSTWHLVDGWPEDSIPIGKPICNSQAYVVDVHDQLQPVGVAGELCVVAVHCSKIGDDRKCCVL